MEMYKIESIKNEDLNTIDYYELDEEGRMSYNDGVICTSDMFFEEGCESAWEYAEWFWNFYGNEIYDDLDLQIDSDYEYKIYEYIV